MFVLFNRPIITNIFRTPLLRNILFVYLAIGILFPVYGVIFEVPLFTKMVIKGAKDDSIIIAEHLMEMIFPDNNKSKRDFLSDDVTAEIKMVVKNFQLEKINLFSKSGEIIYSTDPEDIGKMNRKEYFREIVAKGNIYSTVVQKKGESAEGRMVTADVVETYFPLMDNGTFDGAFEIYYNITDKRESLNGLILRSLSILFALALIIMIAVALVLLHHSKINLERFRQEAELINTKNFLQNILDSSIDGIATTDLHGKVTYCAPKLKDILSYEPEEILGEKMTTFYANGKEDAKKVMKELMELGELTNREIQLRKKDGEKIDVLLSASLLRGKKGALTGTLGIFKDITEKKRLEGNLLHSKKMEAISALAGGIAHEFNNALTGIVGNIQLLEMNFPDHEAVNKHVGPMKTSSYRMAKLTSQLLAYARGGKYQAKSIRLSDFVEDTLPIIKPDIDPSIRFETDLPRDIFSVKADPTQMQIVLSAVVNNSAEANEGKGRIRIVTTNEEIDEDFVKSHPGFHPGRYVCLLVEDDGTGMDEETSNKIFEPFYTTKFMGRGLGMAAVYGIVKNHDGWITVDSELGKGTEVRIYLPALEDKEEEILEKPSEEIEVIPGTGTILVIDDEEVVLNVTRDILERLGYRVLEAKTGNEAVEIAKTFDGDIDLALLDIKLPDIPGGKVYPLIMKARPNLKVVVCSGYSIDSPARNILDAGAQDFIQKPFTIELLSKKLKKALEEK